MANTVKYFFSDRWQFVGKSTDPKPTLADLKTTVEALKYSFYLELDTGKLFYFDGSAWQEVGGQS